MKKLLVAGFALLLAASTSFAQLKQGAWGITAGITGSTSFGVAYALQPNLRLGVDLGFGTSGPSGAKTTTFGFGAGAWYYLGTSENVSAFVGGGLSFESQTQDVPNPTPPPATTSQTSSGFGLGAQFGAEYWFSPKFSAHGFLEFSFGSSSTAGTSSTTIGTSTSTGLTWYF